MSACINIYWRLIMKPVINPSIDILNQAISQAAHVDKELHNDLIVAMYRFRVREDEKLVKLKAEKELAESQERERIYAEVNKINRAGFEKIHHEIISQAKELSENDHQSLKGIFTHFGDMDGIFYSLVRCGKAEYLENKFGVMSKILNFFAKEHQAEYMNALKNAFGRVIEYSRGREIQFGDFLPALLEQRKNVAPANSNVYLNLINNYADSCRQCASSSDAVLTEDAENVRSVVEHYKAKNLDKISAEERTAALKLTDEALFKNISMFGKFPLSMLHRDAIKSMQKVTDFLAEYAKENAANAVTPIASSPQSAGQAQAFVNVTSVALQEQTAAAPVVSATPLVLAMYKGNEKSSTDPSLQTDDLIATSVSSVTSVSSEVQVTAISSSTAKK